MVDEKEDGAGGVRACRDVCIVQRLADVIDGARVYRGVLPCRRAELPHLRSMHHAQNGSLRSEHVGCNAAHIKASFLELCKSQDTHC
jgi:hypothetical protein